MKTVAVLDYGMSNLRSVTKAIEHVAGKDWQVCVTRDADEVYRADKIVFPGQGAIGNCMHLLDETGLKQVIAEVLTEKPFLGICLGQQTLLTHSDENGGCKGFDFIQGNVSHFGNDLADPVTQERLKIPHMGWNQVAQTQDHPLWQGIPDNSRFYFVHSYHVIPNSEAVIAGSCDYGHRFAAAIAKENVFAVQFHPEKSQHMGLALLKNFLAWSGE